ncbi:response regulator transcription factor [Paracoccus zhejiangensis]|uniref:DNA-binding response regulator n=1 Tax=Paracoccus zhejiangensis TaxID=1077935 RepID=A0A2H5F1G2_9RHOB|nr:response regulator transcription factor [Paracoccus zhejiangensis]AUH65367.1 DNA-binding response regulator [Paracoccus zhejiangensis]
MKSALVVDDHPITHLGAGRLLRELGYDDIHQAMNAREAMQQARDRQPGLIVLDITLPDGDGLSMIGDLLVAVPGTRILVFSMNDQTGFAARAIEAGAHGFLSKNAPPEEFRQAIRAQEAGEFYLNPKHAIALATMRAGAGADPLAQLSQRETEVLRQIGQGQSLQAIADELGVSYKTVANTSSALKKKLAVDGMNGLMRIALERGV